MSSVVVFGGYGTFGSLVSRELARLGITVVIAGRRLEKATAFALELGSQHRGVFADIADAESCQRAVADTDVAVHCAGPFAGQAPTVLEACLNAGCHYADIADDRGYVQRVREYHQRFKGAGLTAAFGCSALPGISGALAEVVRKQAIASPLAARCTLFIGNRNPKGLAAVDSLVAGLGKPISAPQGMLRGFYDRESVQLPQPFGQRSVFNFDSPEYDLFAAELGVESITVKVGFELRLVTFGMAALAKISSNWPQGTASLLLPFSIPFRRYGSSGGIVMTELFWPDGSSHSAALHTNQQGQRMAALPCALAAEALCRRTDLAHGAMTVYELLGADNLLKDLQTAGFEMTSQ